ncbi:glycosyltransferase family 4 protein [Shewanella profunda]|uniref:glycosyltransferase family 4 protein n=1 Tax=Shewanella profunda TaxID=254793 RepID=UPI00200D75F7|nr:glycosyltransferase family 4 protein [Shewanella profunda]MCL1090122.1 glycosyltransferase family 4 protein [Shewanella profunda]
MKKVLFILHDSDPLSGATASMLEIIMELNSNPYYDITVLIPNDTKELSQLLTENSIKYVIIRLYHCRYLKQKSFLNSAISYCKAIVRVFHSFLQSIKERKVASNFDIIYSNTSSIYFGAFLSLITNTKHIWHFREFGIEDQSAGHIVGNKLFYKFADFSSCKIIVISKALIVHVQCNVNKDKLVMIYNDVKNVNVDFERVANTNNPLRLLITGSITKGKGQEQVILYLEKLKSMNFDFELSLAGDCSTQYAIDLQSYVESKNLGDNVKFLGFCNDMKHVRLSHDIALIPSISEAFGRVTIEAMHSKMVVLASNTGANLELINHGSNGYLYSDEQSFAECLLSINENREKLIDVGNNAIIFSSQFSVKTASKKIDSLLRLC